MQQLFQGDIQRKGWDYSRTGQSLRVLPTIPTLCDFERAKLSQRFSKHLLLTNTAISFTQIGTADVMQQLFQGDIQRKGWDYSRTGQSLRVLLTIPTLCDFERAVESQRQTRMAAIGFVMGPMLHGFYRVLDSRPFTGGRRKVVMKKLCCDAICMPIFSCTFMT
ncbi:hypothetical protein OSTOST_04104, partial [Ostertagia ostertagi]